MKKSKDHLIKECLCSMEEKSVMQLAVLRVGTGGREDGGQRLENIVGGS